jgi:hypothetical protein
VPFAGCGARPPRALLEYLRAQLNREIEGGDTYPMLEPLDEEGFAAYWFGDFAGVMLQGDWTGGEGGGGVADCMRVLLAAPEVADAVGRVAHDWARLCLGSFYVKPNYPGRSSHVCNGGFLVTDGARNRGVGRLMGEAYLDWAPKLVPVHAPFATAAS